MFSVMFINIVSNIIQHLESHTDFKVSEQKNGGPHSTREREREERGRRGRVLMTDLLNVVSHIYMLRKVGHHNTGQTTSTVVSYERTRKKKNGTV